MTSHRDQSGFDCSGIKDIKQDLPKKDKALIRASDLPRIMRAVLRMLRGQCFVACIVGMLYAIGFWMLSIPYAFFIGMISALGKFIPYLDVLLALSLSIVSAMVFQMEIWTLLGAVLVVIVVGIIDVFFITPKFMGAAIGLHPLVIFVVIILASLLGGVIGAMLAAPVLAVLCEIKAIIDERICEHKSR